jgi:FtsH-binding integral membrane protein
VTKGNRPSRTRAAETPGALTTYRKVTLRLLPFLGLCYLAAYLDRVNIGFAHLRMFEAAPALLLGLCLPLRLDNRVADAKWLSAAERALLADAIEREAVPGRVVRLRDMAQSGMVWMLAAAYFLLTLGAYGLNFWLPSIIKAAGVKSDLSIGLLTAIPYLAGVFAMVSLSARTLTPDAARARAALMCVVGACGLAMSAAFTGQFQAMLAGLSIGVAGVLSATVLFWSVPSLALQGRAVAAGLAAINALGNLGGFVGPYLMGALTKRFGSSKFGLYALAALLVCAGGVLLGAGLKHPAKPEEPVSMN